MTPETITAIGGIFIAATAWLLNEVSKRSHRSFIRKEQRYIELLDNIRGFYVSTYNREQRVEFIRQLNLCWCYCPDEIIKKVIAFLETVHTGKKHTDEQKEKALAELIIAIRKDMLGKKLLFFRRTKLKAEDFRHLTVT